MNFAMWVPVLAAIVASVGLAVNEVIKSRRERRTSATKERQQNERDTCYELIDSLTWLLKLAYDVDPDMMEGSGEADRLLSARVDARRTAERLRDPVLRTQVIELIRRYENASRIHSAKGLPATQRELEVRTGEMIDLIREGCGN